MGLNAQILIAPPNEGIYRSGEKITGTVKINICNNTIIKRIDIFFIGKLKANTKTNTKNDYDRISKENFINLSHTVDNAFQESDTFKEEGVYEHPFEFQLPEDLPSTYRDKICTISYKVSVHFKIDGMFKNKNIVTEIPVYGYVKSCSVLPTYETTKKPFLSNDAIDLNVEIKNAFINAGDNIELNYIINNKAKIAVSTIKTKLISEVIFKLDEKSKTVKKKDLSLVESPGVKENSETKLTCIVPSLPDLFSIGHSKFFSREYKVIVTAILPFPHRDVSVEIPVAIQMNNNIPQIEVNSQFNKIGFVSHMTYVLRPLQSIL